MSLRRAKNNSIELITNNSIPAELSDESIRLAINDAVLKLGSLSPEFNIFDALGT